LRAAGVGKIGDSRLLRDLGKSPAVVAIEAIRQAAFEADEEVEVSVAIEVGPAIGLRTRRSKQLRQHRNEARHEVVRGERGMAGRRHVG
jgi:hypothetical protein